MSVLSVTNLSKHYAHFSLENVSFELEKGRIMGFIGRNGAGKSTTLKSLVHFVHPDSGCVRFFGQTFSDHELEIKQRIGYVSGGVDYYLKKKLRVITDVTRRFYRCWDDTAYTHYMHQFGLQDSKTIAELSAGMRVKYALALALSHHAELLILDEPTSGLDPVSRDELLDIFLDLAAHGVSILFSTHITSDLDKCADDITYIRNGRIIASCDLHTFTDSYRLLECTETDCSAALESKLIGRKRSKTGYTALIAPEDAGDLPVQAADLEAIMVHLERAGDK